jgi:spore maturation protein CgeB
LEGIFRSQETTRRGGYKILLISPLYGGSLPITNYVQRALNALGHRCEVLDNTPFFPGFQHLKTLTSNRGHEARLEAGLNALLAESVTAKALEVRADMVLWMAQSPAIPEVIHELQNGGIRTAFWFVEDYLTLNYWQALAPHLDNFFIIQRDEFVEKLQEIGCENPYYLPVAADPEVHRPLELTPREREVYGSDLSHVGAGYHNRREFFNGLLDFDFKIWGNEWEHSGPLMRVVQRGGARVPTEEIVKIFNAAKININLHSSTYHSGVNPFGDFLNPRTYEIASCGAFQLVDERAYLPENFVPDEEVATFKSRQEFRDKAKYYLDHEDERLEIAAAGRARVLAEHTYQHRMLELMGVLCGRYPDWKPKGGDLPTAEELIQQAGEDSELARVMQRFVGRGPLTLDGVAGEIEREKGELTRTEAMILLLNEFRQWGIEKGVV